MGAPVIPPVSSFFIPLFLGMFALFVPVAHGGVREEAVRSLMDQLRADEWSAQDVRVQALHQTYGDSGDAKDKRLVSLALGVNYLESNPRLALQYLTSAELASRETEALMPIVRYYLAEAKLRAGAPADAVKIADSLMSKEPGPAWSKRLYGLLIESYSQLGDSAKLVEAFQAYSEKFSFSRRQEILAKMAAEAFEKQDDRKKAVEVLEELARSYPSTAESRWAFHKLEDYACDSRKSTGKDRYYFSRRLLLHLSQNIVLGTGLKDLIIAAAERPMVLDDDQTRLLSNEEKAEFLFKARLYKESLGYVKQIYDEEVRKPEPKSLPNLVFEMGRIHLRMYEPMQATRYFSNFLFDYPSHPMAPRALESLGDAMKYLGQPLAAAQNYAAAAAMKDSPHLRWQHFWNLYRGKDLTGALALLETPGYVAPREGDNALTVTYWHAKLLERVGQTAEADAKYREILSSEAETFYAQVIAMTRPDLTKDLKSPPPKGETRRFSLAARLVSKEATSAADFAPLNPELKVVDDLLKVGLRETADVQLAGLKNATYAQEDSFAAASRISLALNDYQSARRIRYSPFSALKQMPSNWLDFLKHQSDNSDEWKLYYPIAFEKIVAPIAAKIRINPFIILSVMRAESFYNREARSGVGAQGLMQLMPYTAVKIASLLKDEAFDVRDLGNAHTNIGYGAYYLDKLLRYYEGNPFVAVAAYNGGPMVVNQWLDSCKDCSADEFADSIPYRETRRYVREVMKNYAQYARIYAGKAPFTELPALPTELPDGEEIF